MRLLLLYFYGSNETTVYAIWQTALYSCSTCGGRYYYHYTCPECGSHFTTQLTSLKCPTSGGGWVPVPSHGFYFVNRTSSSQNYKCGVYTTRGNLNSKCKNPAVIISGGSYGQFAVASSGWCDRCGSGVNYRFSSSGGIYVCSTHYNNDDGSVGYIGPHDNCYYICSGTLLQDWPK